MKKNQKHLFVLLTLVTVIGALIMLFSVTAAAADTIVETFESENFTAYLYEDGRLVVKPVSAETTILRWPEGQIPTSQMRENADAVTSVIIKDGFTEIGDFFVPYYRVGYDQATYHPLFLNMESLTVPSGVTTIRGGAFFDCTGLKEVTLPDSVTVIGELAFRGCSSLETITLPKTECYYGRYAFAHCSALTDLTMCASRISSSNLFEGCSSLKTVTFLEGMTELASGIFDESTVESVILPRSLETIHNDAFKDCRQLKSVVMPGVKGSIACFEGCSSLESVVLPEGVTSLGNVVVIDYIFLPDERYEYYAFKGCSSLKSVTLPSSLEEIGDYAFQGCRLLENLEIPAGVKTIGKQAFWACASLQAVDLPDALTTIEDETFYGCSSLEEIAIPNKVTSIGDYAFASCRNLTQVSVPQAVRSIGEAAFSDCYNLSKLYLGRNSIAMGPRIFENISQLITIYTCHGSETELLNHLWQRNPNGESYSDPYYPSYLPEYYTVVTGSHNIVYVPARQISMTENGCKEHYACTMCDAVFTDAAGENEIDPDSIVRKSHLIPLHNFFLRLKEFFQKVAFVIRALFKK